MNILEAAQKYFPLKQLGWNVWGIDGKDSHLSSLKIWPSTNSWYRFSNQTGGSTREFLQFIVGLSQEQIAEILPLEEAAEDFSWLFRKDENNETTLVDILGHRTHDPYLSKRGINETTSAHFGIERANQSVIFPITDRNGKRIGSQYRYTFPTAPVRYKFVMLPGNEKPQFWRLDFWTFDKTRIIAEGAIKTMRMWQVMSETLTNCSFYATMGNRFDPEKSFGLLLDVPTIFILDPDEAGKNLVECARNSRANAEFYQPPKAVDEMSDDEIRGLFRSIWRKSNFKLL